MKDEALRPVERVELGDELRATLLGMDASSTAPKSWVQIARTGRWKGHSVGEFEFDREVYEAMVANFRATLNRQLPVDFEHAAEDGGGGGGIYQLGAPAQAWVVDLRYDDDRLEALFQWVPTQPGLRYVREGAYKFTSPAVMFRARDRVTAREIGPTLTSVALTNRPFLDGLRPVTATDSPVTGLSAMAAFLSSGVPGAPTSERQTMKTVLTALGLAETANEAEALGAVVQLRDACRAIEPLKTRAETHALTCKALGLPETASAGDVAAKVVELTARAGKVEALEAEVATFRDAQSKRDAADAESDVEYVLTHGGERGAPVASPSAMRPALMALRTSDPAKFAESFKSVLEGKRRFDAAHLFRTETHAGGALAPPAGLASQGNASVRAADPQNSDFMTEVARVQAEAEKRGTKLSLGDAMAEVHRGHMRAALGAG